MEKEIISENKNNYRFVRIDFVDDRFRQNIMDASKRIVSDILRNDSVESLYDKFNNFIEINSMDAFRESIIYTTYLMHCLDRVVYPCVIKQYYLNDLDINKYLNSNVKVYLEKDLTIFNNNNRTCYIDLTTGNIFLV